MSQRFHRPPARRLRGRICRARGGGGGGFADGGVSERWQDLRAGSRPDKTEWRRDFAAGRASEHRQDCARKCRSDKRAAAAVFAVVRRFCRTLRGRRSRIYFRQGFGASPRPACAKKRPDKSERRRSVGLCGDVGAGFISDRVSERRQGLHAQRIAPINRMAAVCRTLRGRRSRILSLSGFQSAGKAARAGNRPDKSDGGGSAGLCGGIRAEFAAEKAF